MEPRIIKGHLFRCKKSVIGEGDKKAYYIKGKIYKCDLDSYYPDSEHEPSAKHMVGTITNEFGNPHCWPYVPEHHLWCHDSWTDYFEDLGEENTNN